MRDLRWPPLTNQILCLEERLERFSPDHSITRRLVNLLRAGPGTDQMQEGHVAASKIFVSGANAPEMFDARTEALDHIAAIVQMV